MTDVTGEVDVTDPVNDDVDCAVTAWGEASACMFATGSATCSQVCAIFSSPCAV